MKRVVIPLRERPLDLVFVIFFGINLLFVSYVISLEQLVIADPSDFEYPVWPPAFMIDAVHWYGANFDPPLMARPPWWQATIWIDVLFFGPFYAVALYAYTKGREWIRIPSIIWGSVMFTNVFIILNEEVYGAHAAGDTLIWVFLANGAWLVMPFVVIGRMWRAGEHPFTRPQESSA